MSASFSSPERVPFRAVERLLRNFASFVELIDAALRESDTAPGVERWKRAHALLQEEEQALQSEAALFQRDDREPLLRHASQLRLLAGRMDGYGMNFAGDTFAAELAKQRRLLVLNAWQIAAAANDSEASGL